MADEQLNLTPEQQAMLGKLLAGQFKEMQQSDAAFDPRGGRGEEIDTLTSEMLKSLMGDESGTGGYEKVIVENPELKNIVDTLIANPVLVPYVSTWITEKREMLKVQIDTLVKSMFPSASDGEGT